MSENLNLSVTVSSDILRSISQGTGPEDYFIALGCMGWENEQLQEELNNNQWLVAPAAPALIIHADLESRYRLAAGSIGIKNISRLTAVIGNA